MNDSIILEARAMATKAQPHYASAKAWQLTDEHFCDAVQAQLAGVSYPNIVAMLQKSGVEESALPGRTAWSRFWHSFRHFLRTARRRAAANGANEAALEATRSPAEFDAATLDLVRQMAFELADSEASDPKDVQSFVSLLLKHKDQQLKERQVDLAERRLALLEQQAEAARTTLGNETLTPEQRERKMRDIFGI